MKFDLKDGGKLAKLMRAALELPPKERAAFHAAFAELAKPKPLTRHEMSRFSYPLHRPREFGISLSDIAYLLQSLPGDHDATEMMRFLQVNPDCLPVSWRGKFVLFPGTTHETRNRAMVWGIRVHDDGSFRYKEFELNSAIGACMFLAIPPTR